MQPCLPQQLRHIHGLELGYENAAMMGLMVDPLFVLLAMQKQTHFLSGLAKQIRLPVSEMLPEKYDVENLGE